MVQLSNNKFRDLFIPALVVIAAVLIKNGGAQYYKNKGKKMDSNVKNLGMLLFAVGWMGVAYTLYKGKYGHKAWLPVLASAAIVGSVAGMAFAGKKYKNLFAGLFVLGWIALGYFVAEGKGNTAMMMGLGASGLVLASMLFALPWQRTNKVIDGPGIGLFSLGWVVLAAAHAL